MKVSSKIPWCCKLRWAMTPKHSREIESVSYLIVVVLRDGTKVVGSPSPAVDIDRGACGYAVIDTGSASKEESYKLVYRTRTDASGTDFYQIASLPRTATKFVDRIVSVIGEKLIYQDHEEAASL